MMNLFLNINNPFMTIQLNLLIVILTKYMNIIMDNIQMLSTMMNVDATPLIMIMKVTMVMNTTMITSMEATTPTLNPNLHLGELSFHSSSNFIHQVLFYVLLSYILVLELILYSQIVLLYYPSYLYLSSCIVYQALPCTQHGVYVVISII